MTPIFNAARRLFWRCRIRMLAAEQKTIDRVLHEADIDLLNLRLRRNDLALELSHARGRYRLIAKPFETTTKGENHEQNHEQNRAD